MTTTFGMRDVLSALQQIEQQVGVHVDPEAPPRLITTIGAAQLDDLISHLIQVRAAISAESELEPEPHMELSEQGHTMFLDLLARVAAAAGEPLIEIPDAERSLR